MSNNPLTRLRDLISAKDSAYGVVMEINATVIKVATSRGLVEYPNPGGLVIGESINIKSGQIYKRSTGEVYWI